MSFKPKGATFIKYRYLLAALPLAFAACSKPSTSAGSLPPASSVAVASAPTAVSAPALSSPVAATATTANDDSDGQEADESGVAVGTVMKIGQSADDRTAETPFGKLSTDNDNVLLLDGKPVNPRIEGNNSLSFIAQVALKNSRAVLVQNNGGTACPALYHWAILADGGYIVSPEFGSCSDLAKVSTAMGKLVVAMPGFVGDDASGAEQKRVARRKMTYVYDGKTLTENGKPVTGH